eukprot:8703088-Alexandrium_andersonii.AAC.1
MIVWSLNALASGVYPAFKHDRAPFGDELRANQRGFALAGGACGSLCERRTGRSEFASAWGF